MKALYAFIDEGGDFNFSPTGSRYFTITSVAVSRPFPIQQELNELRFNLLERGLEIPCFHATTDRQATRDQVFTLIQGVLPQFRVDSVIVEKRKTGPSLRPPEKFYPRMLGYLLRYLVRGTDWAKWSELIVIADRIEEKKRRRALEGAVKTTLASVLPENVRYRVLHHESASSYSLQIADYLNWAIYRAWTNGDHRSLTLVRPAIRSQFDIFESGTTRWY